MGSPAFDTLKAAKRLGAAGFDLDQSESLAGIIGESITDKLATKDDLINLEMRLTGKIESGDERLTGKIEALDAKIDSVEERLTGKIEALDAKIDSVEERLTGKIEALDAKIDSVEERLTGKIEVLDTKIDSVEERLTGKFEKQGIEVCMQIATLKAEIAEAQVSLHRWMIGLVVTLVLGFAGMILVG